MQKTQNTHPIATGSMLAVGALFLAACASMPPPTEEVTKAEAAVTQAEGAGARDFAPLELRTAQEKLDRAKAAMKEDDEDNYATARRLAEEAEADAKLAATKARTAKAQKAATELQEGINTLRQELNRKSPSSGEFQ